MKSDLYLSHILERCEAFWVPRSPIRVHGRRLCKQLSTQNTKICQFLQTQFANIIKPSNLRHSVIISRSNNRGLLANVILENAYSTFVCVSGYGVHDSEEKLLFIKATMGMDPENQFQIWKERWRPWQPVSCHIAPQAWCRIPLRIPPFVQNSQNLQDRRWKFFSFLYSTFCSKFSEFAR